VYSNVLHTVFETLIREHKILLYLDNILVAMENLDEDLAILSELSELAKSHLQFRVDKCYFAQTEIKYLSYCVNEYGIRPSDENIEAVLNYPIREIRKKYTVLLALQVTFVGLFLNFRCRLNHCMT